jgi:dihydrofolate reductase
LERAGGTTFSFVTDGGVDEAVARARAAAGGKDVHVSGGARIVNQAVAAGLVDELHLHVAPVLLGEGMRLFESLPRTVELEIADVVRSPHVTHLRYRVRSGPGGQ